LLPCKKVGSACCRLRAAAQINVCASNIFKEEEKNRKQNFQLRMLKCVLAGIRSQSLFGYSRISTMLIFSLYSVVLFRRQLYSIQRFDLDA
jgi:hypothetical protein